MSELNISREIKEEWQNMLNRLIPNPDYQNQLTRKKLEDIEEKIGYKLPELYKTLLLMPGVSLKVTDTPEIELFSLNNFKSDLSNEYEFSNFIQNYYKKPYDFPKYIFPFGSISHQLAEPICFDLSKMKDGDCPVYEYDFDFNMWDAPRTGEREEREGGLSCRYPTMITNSFEEFMLKLVNGTLHKERFLHAKS